MRLTIINSYLTNCAMNLRYRAPREISHLTSVTFRDIATAEDVLIRSLMKNAGRETEECHLEALRPALLRCQILGAKRFPKGAPFAHRTRALIYSATKIITAVKIPPGVFTDRHASPSCVPPHETLWRGSS